MATFTRITTPLNNSCKALIASHGNSTVPLPANSDIAGIGVIISFIISAYVVLAAAIFCYLLNLLPLNILNTYDVQFCKRKTIHGKHQAAYMAFFKTLAVGVLAASDVQLLQGIAILIAAFVNVASMTVFDWQIVVYLGWVSSNVHLTTLLFLQDYLHKQPILLRVRVGCMLLLLVLILVAFIPTSNWNWVLAVTRPYDRSHYPSDGGDHYFALNYAMPSTCFWHRPFNTAGTQPLGFAKHINPDAPFAYLALIIAYTWRIFILKPLTRRKPSPVVDPEDTVARSFRSTNDYRLAAEYWVQMKLLRLYARQAKQTAIYIQRRLNDDTKTSKFDLTLSGLYMIFRLWCILYATTLALFDFFRSFVASLWILLLLLFWGTFEIANVRNKTLPHVNALLNQWQFGQILPMILLAVPGLAIAQHFMRNWYDEDEGEEREATVLRHAFNDFRTRAKSSLKTLRPGNLWRSIRKTLSTLNQRTEKDRTSRPLFFFFRDLPELDKEAARHVSLNYFYQDKLFKSLLLLPNLMALTGGIVALWFEGRTVGEDGAEVRAQSRGDVKDPKGWVWKYIGIIFAAAAGFWIVWSGVIMIWCGLFEIPRSRLNHPDEPKERRKDRSAGKVNPETRAGGRSNTEGATLAWKPTNEKHSRVFSLDKPLPPDPVRTPAESASSREEVDTSISPHVLPMVVTQGRRSSELSPTPDVRSSRSSIARKALPNHWKPSGPQSTL